MCIYIYIYITTINYYKIIFITSKKIIIKIKLNFLYCIQFCCVVLKKKEFNKKKKKGKRFSQRKQIPRRTRRSEPPSCRSMASTRRCCHSLGRLRPESWSNALSWVLWDRSLRKLSKTSSLKASTTSVLKILATLAIATTLCRFNPNHFAFFFFFSF